MQAPLRICVIGCGYHSTQFHLPVLAEYNKAHPAAIILCCVVDNIEAKARSAAAKFGFARTYADTDEMLRGEKPDACVVCTPEGLNASVAIKLMRAGIPLLMEKPMGVTLEEAREVVRVAAETKARVMMSMNRRYDPQVRAALDWMAGRPARYIRATMARVNRKEPGFLRDTGVHIVDAVCMLGGNPVRHSGRHYFSGDCAWAQVMIDFENGAHATVDLMPTTGMHAETIELFGNNYKVEIHASDSGWGWRAWAGGKLEREEKSGADFDEFLAVSSRDETMAFIENLIHDRPLYPQPAEVLSSTEVCHLAAGNATLANTQLVIS
ncbi:Gfo/Idh/MocA family oxidoreductase [Termitidicoccus mucosus]|uniref:Gfo/Idh/MocA family protein n=1 Tax=Termitidicoccus mucosus TaxID=1184151 RepID=UPI000A04FE15